MAVLAAEKRMAKKATGRPRGDRNDAVVKIDREIAAMAKVLAAAMGISSAKLLSDLVRIPLERAYEKRFRNLGKERKEDKG